MDLTFLWPAIATTVIAALLIHRSVTVRAKEVGLFIIWLAMVGVVTGTVLVVNAVYYAVNK